MFFYDKYDIIIVGGGISGLFLAYKLMNTKLNILLIEGSDRYGGRIHTIYKDSYFYESGASRFCNKHNKLLTLIDELGLKQDIIEIPKEFDMIIHNKKIKINIYNYFKKVLLESKEYKKEYLENITFFQLIINVYDFDTAELIKNVFGYDSELLNLNAHAAIAMFKKDLFDDKAVYYLLKNGLSSMINKLVEVLEYSPYVTLNKKEELIEIEDDVIKTKKGLKYNYEKLILTIPKESLKKIEYLKDIKELESVRNIKLLRIYMKYSKIWFKDIKRTSTNNYLRQIIPVDYDNGLIMVSYTDGYYGDMLMKLYNRGKDELIKAVHKEIHELFGIKPPEPDEVHVEYWENGCHFWDTGEDMNKVYDKILKPLDDKELYICGESYCKRQAWMEGSLAMCYDVIKKMKFKDIKVKVKKDKKLKKYNIDDVLKHHKWIILEIDDELRIYDLTKWIEEYSDKDKIYDSIEANMYYKDKSKSPKSPTEILMNSDKYIIKKIVGKKNKYVKHIGFLI